MSKNLIPNGTFTQGGSLPEAWTFRSLMPNIEPVFQKVDFQGSAAVLAHGGGNPNCVGHLVAKMNIKCGETYKLKVLFHITEDIDPQQHLMFSLYADDFTVFNNGIFKFKKLGDNWVCGENTFYVPGEGELPGEARITFRLNGTGIVHIREMTMEATDPIPPRPVKIACSKAKPAPGTWDEHWSYAFDQLEGRGIDLFLMPEVFNDCEIEGDDGPGIQFMAKQAKRHKMYVSGSILYRDPRDGYVYNAALLFDRNGKLCGRYDKNHPFSNEILNMGVLPGHDVPVFDTDFGKVGMLICYDSWFTDVAELLALKGAEIILFPNAGYYRSLVPARAADNCVRIVSSSLDGDCGIWDTSGADVCCPDLDTTRHSKCDTTFNDVLVEQIGEVKIVSCVMDLSQSPSPHNWGGPLMSAPGGRRNRREQHRLLYDQIQREIKRWWD